jgi:hypothetical protein
MMSAPPRVAAPVLPGTATSTVARGRPRAPRPDRPGADLVDRPRAEQLAEARQLDVEQPRDDVDRHVIRGDARPAGGDDRIRHRRCLEHRRLDRRHLITHERARGDGVARRGGGGLERVARASSAIVRVELTVTIATVTSSRSCAWWSMARVVDAVD